MSDICVTIIILSLIALMVLAMGLIIIHKYWEAIAIHIGIFLISLILVISIKRDMIVGK